MKNSPALLALVFLISSCGSASAERIRVTDTDDEACGTCEDSPEAFNSFLPATEDSGDELASFYKNTRVTPIFPEGDELQKCVASILFYRRSEPRPDGRNYDLLPLYICFPGAAVTELDRQTRSELGIVARILGRHEDNSLILLPIDEVPDRALAGQRMIRVRSFLLESGVPERKVIIQPDSPPE